MDKTGWFLEPNAMGMESVWDKVSYNPFFGKITFWDFSKYQPQVVIIAIGQNDSHPMDYMAENIDSKRAKEWKCHYRDFVKKIRSVYKNALIVLQTTLLYHHENWDGSGYPDRLTGIGIPLAAQIVSIAEAYCALTGEEELSREEALEVMGREAGIKFNPTIYEICRKISRQLC